MKAVIVERSNGAAVALCDDGTFKKVRDKNYSIGQELWLKDTASHNRIMKTLSICASFAFVLLSIAGIGSYSYVTPYSYVSLDINPSIEYALNRYDKVIRVSGMNDDGQQIVSSIESDIKNQNITTALGVTISQLEKDNYISEKEDNHVIISVCSNNDNKAQAIASRVNTFSQEESQICSIDTLTVSQEVKENADSLGITPGKLVLINAVAETSADANFDVTEWTDKTVSELEITIQQASNNTSGDGSMTADATVIDSEFISSVLDDITDNPDSSAAASTTGADTESSTSTDNTTADNTTVSDVSTNADTNASSEQTVTPPAVNNNPSNEAAASDKNTSSGNNASGQNSSDKINSNKDASDKSTNEKDDFETSSDSKGSSSPSKDVDKPDSSAEEDADASTDSEINADDSFTEETSSKKDDNPDSAVDTEFPEDTENSENAEDAVTADQYTNAVVSITNNVVSE